MLPVYKRLMQEAGTSDSVEGNGQEMISTLTHLLERIAEDPRKVKKLISFDNKAGFFNLKQKPG